MANAPGVSNAAAIAACNAIVDLLDVGGAGRIDIMDGIQPTYVDDAITTQNVLSTHLLTNPAFGAAADDTGKATATAAAIGDDTSANNSGTATWFRAYSGAGTAVIQGSAGTSGTDAILDSASIEVGQLVQVNSWTFSCEES